MKKTLVFILLSVFLTTGCKYFRKRTATLQDTLVADTTRANTVAADSASYMPPPATVISDVEPASSGTGGTYYMIVGSFTVPQNADNFARKLKDKGYESQILQGKGGFRMVSARSYGSLKEIVAELDKFRSEVDPGAWVYRAR
jgi:hypothetical protein